MTLYIASTNPGKLRDFAAAATQYTKARIDLAPLPNLKDIPPPDEDQPTFEGNARLKAIFYSQYLPSEIVLADDSGLEVDALHGAPGIRSARFASDHHDHSSLAGPATNPATNPDQRNNLYLQQALAALPGPHTARYRCVLAAARDGQILCTADGTVDGEILPTQRGTQGFGYDPLFYLPAMRKTMAELDISTKLAFSHRGRAFASMLETLFDRVNPNQGLGG